MRAKPPPLIAPMTRTTPYIIKAQEEKKKNKTLFFKN
jgi:hypothetical protein